MVYLPLIKYENPASLSEARSANCVEPSFTLEIVLVLDDSSC